MKYIPGFENYYSVTEDGLVWSHGSRNGAGHFGRFMKSTPDKDGYSKIMLSINGKRYTKRVGRCVLSAFRPTELSWMQVNHIDGNRRNDRLGNLEWVTPSDNIKHSFKILNKNQKNEKNNAFKIWGYTINGITTLVKDQTIDGWCHCNKIASTAIHASMREKRSLTKGRFKGYEFFRGLC